MARGERINLVLTEARAVLPGVQALSGFQFVVVLSEAFGKLPASSAMVHLGALAAVAGTCCRGARAEGCGH